MKLPQNIDLYAKLANNITQTQMFLDRMWKDFGNFSSEHTTEKFKAIVNELSKEVNGIQEKSLEKDACWSTAEKILRSIYALIFFASKPPEAPGHYFAYHINRFTSSNPYKYIQDNRLWPYGSFDIKPNDFNKCLTNISSVLSNGNLKGVSILDLPAFGSKFEDSCYGAPWSIQLNFAIYNQLMSRSNESSSNYFDSKIFNECSTLQDLWRDYMSDPAVHDFPPKTSFNSDLFNFTKYIKEDLTSFLIAYTASIKSIPTQSSNPSSIIWSDIAKNEFPKDTVSEKVVSYNDKLVQACAFQEPLEPVSVHECGDFQYSLTSNGMCYSYNGMDTSKLWQDGKITKVFTETFGRYQTKIKRFRGIGHSEGKPVLQVVYFVENLYFPIQ